jgi:hypothetical protein
MAAVAAQHARGQFHIVITFRHDPRAVDFQQLSTEWRLRVAKADVVQGFAVAIIRARVGAGLCLCLNKAGDGAAGKARIGIGFGNSFGGAAGHWQVIAGLCRLKQGALPRGAVAARAIAAKEGGRIETVVGDTFDQVLKQADGFQLPHGPVALMAKVKMMHARPDDPFGVGVVFRHEGVVD